MAGSKSDYLEKAVLDHLWGKTTFTAPATVYCALFTATPSDAGGGTEVSGGSYARVPVVNNTTNFPAATGTTPATKTTGSVVTFPAPTADWGQVTQFALFDLATGGNQLVWGDLTTPRPINNGDGAPSFAAGTLTITED